MLTFPLWLPFLCQTFSELTTKGYNLNIPSFFIVLTKHFNSITQPLFKHQSIAGSSCMYTTPYSIYLPSIFSYYACSPLHFSWQIKTYQTFSPPPPAVSIQLAILHAMAPFKIHEGTKTGLISKRLKINNVTKFQVKENKFASAQI